MANTEVSLALEILSTADKMCNILIDLSDEFSTVALGPSFHVFVRA